MAKMSFCKSSFVGSMVRVGSEGKIGPVDSKPERRVLVIYTGGTIGMIRNDMGVLAPVPDLLKEKIRSYPQLHDEEFAVKRFGPNPTHNYLVLPCCNENCRVIYTIKEYDPLLDSSDMSMDDWIRIAIDIKRWYEIYDGFVVLHGTDTLSYTASALSFMMENLGKTIVLTGSQIPIFEARSDGKDNFLNALLIAGNYVIPEVTIMFNNKLLRGNRTIKFSSNNFNGFSSFNMKPLGEVGMKIKIDYRNIFRPTTIAKFNVHTQLSRNVCLLRIFPSMTYETVKIFLQPPMAGVVLQSYGSGNIPSNRKDILDLFAEAAKRGVIIVNCTQCPEGAVDEVYEAGAILYRIGVIPGADITPEGALAKLSYVLSKDDWSIETKRATMRKSIRGEMSSQNLTAINKWNLVEAVATSLNLTSPEDIHQLCDVICPALLMSAVAENNLAKVKTLEKLGVDLMVANFDGRTALHVACSCGHIDIVKYMLKCGCSIHARDRLDRTPLMDAIEGDHHSVVRLLVQCGAHLTGSNRLLGEMIALAAASGNVTRLQSYQLAGANMGQVDGSGRNALHVAALHHQCDAVDYLLRNGCNPNHLDMTGTSAVQIAKQQNCPDILELFANFNYEQLSM